MTVRIVPGGRGARVSHVGRVVAGYVMSAGSSESIPDCGRGVTGGGTRGGRASW